MTTPAGPPEGFRPNPTMVLYILNTAVALAVSFGLPLSHPMVQAITVIATAVLSGLAALATRPITVSALAAAASTALAAAAAFGLHLTTDQIGQFVGLGSLIIGLVTHVAVSPHPALAAAAASARARRRNRMASGT